MPPEKRDFDKEAASWDEQPNRVKLATDVANAISQHITLTSEMEVLDFGCGTGLVSLRLASQVKSVTGLDSSPAMLDVFQAKARQQKLNNTRTLKLDLDGGDCLRERYDLIISSRALHHIKNIEPLLQQLYHATKVGGHLGIADLDSDAGQFHDNNTGVFHFGFERSVLRRFFTQAGFNSVVDSTAAEIIKPTPTGETRRFTVFLMMGRK